MIMPPLSVTMRAQEMWPLLQYAPLCIVVIDGTGRIVFANDRLGALLGYTPPELTGKPLSMLLPSRLHAVHDTHVTHYMRQPQSRPMGVGMNLVGRHKAGHELPVEVGLSSFRTPDGTWVMAVVNSAKPGPGVEDAVAEERNRIARELHDAVSQSLFAASANADVLPRLVDTEPAEAQLRAQEIRTLTRGALAELRTVLFELRPQAIEAASLRDLLRQLVDAAAGRGQLAVTIELSGEGEDPPLAIKTAFYRIAQETLNNVVRHAQAHHVWLRLERRADHTALTIIDDGVGFDPASVTGDHHGMAIMCERAAEVGASVHTASTAGIGTTVVVRWPGSPTPDGLTSQRATTDVSALAPVATL